MQEVLHPGFSCIVGHMQKMLRRTVTVGSKHALLIWTIFLFGLSILLSLVILSTAFDWQSFPYIAVAVIFYCVAGLIGSTFALWQIQNKADQIREDLRRLLNVRRVS